MTGELLLEIGTEEIPAGYLDPALTHLAERAQTLLDEARIPVSGDLEAQGTPRRLVLMGTGIAETQTELVQEMTGPPQAVAFDQEGNPTKAALGFARKQRVAVEDLGIIETPRGAYVHVRQTIAGKPTETVLPELLGELIRDIPWPKSMRWGSVGFPFARPIHWILALFQGRVVPFDLAGVSTGDLTRGHRFVAPEAVAVHSIAEYRRAMEQGAVILDRAERRERVASVVREAVGEAAGAEKRFPRKDSELTDLVTHLVEFPSAVCGTFDREFLDLPDAVLITAMREHQKYFAVVDEKGRLQPHFVAVNNTLARDPGVVCRGHERVLRARLSDAAFFFAEDRKTPLAERRKELQRVIYQKDLGTSHAKVARFTALAVSLAEQVLPGQVDVVRTAAQLCKCDLVTQMVGEFPSLQGVMGKEYAALEGYAPEIAEGIYEHYLPVRSEGVLPASAVGAVVGFADRMDTITGGFAVGLGPTGNTDPFALRRHALAVLRILEQFDWRISLSAFIRQSLALLGQGISLDKDRLFEDVLGFFRERYRHLLLRRGYDGELIESVLSVHFDDIRALPAHLEAVRAFTSASERFSSLVATYKRVRNMLKNRHESFSVDEALLEDPAEKALWARYTEIAADVAARCESGAYQEALDLTGRMKTPVDDFFDGVEILTDRETLRNNRIALLQAVERLCRSAADLSCFTG